MTGDITINKYGIDGLKESKTWKKYSQALKENAIKEYLSGEFSQIDPSPSSYAFII